MEKSYAHGKLKLFFVITLIGAFYGCMSIAPFEAISTSQDDSRQCEHLLSLEFCASCSDV